MWVHVYSTISPCCLLEYACILYLSYVELIFSQTFILQLCFKIQYYSLYTLTFYTINIKIRQQEDTFFTCSKFCNVLKWLTAYFMQAVNLENLRNIEYLTNESQTLAKMKVT